jgi:hypothetical protein
LRTACTSSLSTTSQSKYERGVGPARVRRLGGGGLTRNWVRRYHLKDVIVGKIYFLLVRIKIKHMELSIIRRETTGAGSSPSQRHSPSTAPSPVFTSHSSPPPQHQTSTMSQRPSQSSRSWTARPYEVRSRPDRPALASERHQFTMTLLTPLRSSCRRDDTDPALPGRV